MLYYNFSKQKSTNNSNIETLTMDCLRQSLISCFTWRLDEREIIAYFFVLSMTSYNQFILELPVYMYDEQHIL